MPGPRARIRGCGPGLPALASKGTIAFKKRVSYGRRVRSSPIQPPAQEALKTCRWSCILYSRSWPGLVLEPWAGGATGALWAAVVSALNEENGLHFRQFVCYRWIHVSDDLRWLGGSRGFVAIVKATSDNVAHLGVCFVIGWYNMTGS